MNRSGRKSSRNANEEPADEIKDLKLIVEKLVQENKELTATVAESIKSNEFISAMFEEYKKSNEEVLQKLNEITKQNKLLIEKNQTLEGQIKMEKEEREKLEERLYAILNPLEVEKRCKNLEMHGMEETENENCHEKVKGVLAQITPKTVEVVNSYRIGYKFKRTGEKNTRRILIKFENREQRDIAYASRANLRKLEGQRLYLNEDLPPNLRFLRGKANTFRKEKDFKFLWIKNGNVLLRKSEDSKIFTIKKASDLEKVV